MKALDFVKRHPMAIGIGAVVVIGGFLLLNSGGSSGTASTATSGTSDAEIAAGLQLQQLQAASAAQNYQVGAQRDVALAQTNAQLELGKLQIQQQGASDELASALGMAKINADQQTTSLTSTLAAQTQQAGIAAQTAQNAAMLATITRQAELQTQTSVAAINAQTKIAEINRPRSFLESIFG